MIIAKIPSKVASKPLVDFNLPWFSVNVKDSQRLNSSFLDIAFNFPGTQNMINEDETTFLREQLTFSTCHFVTNFFNQRF